MIIKKASVILYILYVLITPLKASAFNSQIAIDRIERALDANLRSDIGVLMTNLDNSSLLSETISLEMEYRARAGDRESFDRQLSLMKKNFQSPFRLLYWKLNDKGKPSSPSNASIDDLRAVRALFYAYDRWGDDSFKKEAISLADSIFSYNVRKNVLSDGSSWKESITGSSIQFGPGKKLSLSSIDVFTLKRLTSIDSKWLPVARNSIGILAMGMGNTLSPRWGWDIEKSAYNEDDDNPINYMIDLVTLSEGGFVPKKQIGLLVDKIRKDSSSVVEGRWKNVAVCSLISLALIESGFNREASVMMEYLLDNYSIKEGRGAGLLGYVQPNGKSSAWAFDNLLALIVLVNL